MRLTASLALLLAACATTPSLPDRAAAQLGRSEADLVATLGAPTRTYEAGDRRFLLFEDRRSIPLPGDTALYGRGLTGARPRVDPPTARLVARCDVTVALRAGRVEGFTARGDGCPGRASL